MVHLSFQKIRALILLLDHHFDIRKYLQLFSTKENKIISEIESKSIPSMLHTVDDYLSCVGVAEKIVDKT
jgi:hypothetical protein